MSFGQFRLHSTFQASLCTEGDRFRNQKQTSPTEQQWLSGQRHSPPTPVTYVLSPGPAGWKEKTNPHKLFSDLHTCVMACAHQHRYTHSHIHTINH